MESILQRRWRLFYTRNPDLETSSPPVRCRGDIEVAIVLVHDSYGNGQSEAGAALFCRVEGIEDGLAEVWRNPRALVIDGDYSIGLSSTCIGSARQTDSSP